MPGTSMFWMYSSGSNVEKSRPKWPEIQAIAPSSGMSALIRSYFACASARVSATTVCTP